MSDINKQSVAFIRQALGCIDLSDVEEKEIGEAERKEYCAAISAIFPRIERDIKKFLYEQLIKTSMQAESWDQVLVGRGVFAGMEILLEHWKKAHLEYVEKGKPKEEFDKNNPIGEV